MDASCITAPLFALLRARGFDGTADALLASLAKHTDEATTKQKGGGNLEEQSAWLEALRPGGIPLPGRPGGPPLTEDARKALEEVKTFSPADRMAFREGFTAAVRLSDLARGKPDPEG